MILRAYQERASMRGCARLWRVGYRKRRPSCQRFCWLLSLTTCWNWMSYGHLCEQSATNAGSGLPSVVEPDRSSPASSATAAPTVAWLCASSSPKATTLVVPAATSGIGLRRRNAPRRGQGNRRNRPRRTLEQHPATTFGPLCAQDPGFFQVRPFPFVWELSDSVLHCPCYESSVGLMVQAR